MQCLFRSSVSIQGMHPSVCIELVGLWNVELDNSVLDYVFSCMSESCSPESERDFFLFCFFIVLLNKCGWLLHVGSIVGRGIV